jgi:ubiquinone/menaquinone biosynthesis C-methylase UbiE
MLANARMRLADPSVSDSCPEVEVYESLLPLAGARVLDIGCGDAQIARAIATTRPDASIVGLEADAIQHAINISSERPRTLTFGYGAAQAIPADDGAFDVVTLFKSLHHVPLESLDAALTEVRRVLRPGGLAYISEPVFAGELNEIVRIFHDEQELRREAFNATCRAVDRGMFELVEERFFLVPVAFRDFAEFERRVIGVTHTKHRLGRDQFEEVRARFLRHCAQDGARFLSPTRVDLLRRVS